MAERLGVRTETVANWERGLERPLARHHGALIRFLGFDPSPPAQTLPERLLAIRLRLGLTQEAMADNLGLDEGTIMDLEKGRRSPSKTTLQKIGALLRPMEEHGVEPAE